MRPLALFLVLFTTASFAQKRMEAGIFIDSLSISQTSTNNFGLGARFGYRVHHDVLFEGEVEAVIYQHPSVLEAAVFGIPDPNWGELVVACVVLKPGKTLSGDELTDHCRRSLANYKVPRRIEFSGTELPKGGTGKIVKRDIVIPDGLTAS